MRPSILALSVVLPLLCAARVYAADVPILQANHVFSQETVSLASGDTLVVRNDDGTMHDLVVTDEDGEPQDLGPEQPGKTLRIGFANSGSFTVRCSLTPGMTMRVNVR